MPLTMNDFKQESTLTLQDLAVEPTNPGVAISDSNAAMLAAEEASLTGLNEDNYLAIKRDMLDPEARERRLAEHVKIRRALYQDAFYEAPSILADEKLDDSIRQYTLMELAQPNPDGEVPTTIRQAMLEEASVADSGKNETQRAAEARANAFSGIETLIRHKEYAQSAINRIALQDELGLAEGIVDFAELVVPFAEFIDAGHKLTKANSKFGTTEDKVGTIPLLGEMKKDLYELSKTIPLDQREEFMEYMVNLIDQSDTVIVNDGNTLVKLDMINNALMHSDYSNVERFIDDATTVLDVVGVGSLIRWFKSAGKGAKSVADVKKAMELAREADKFKGTPDVPVGPLADEAAAFKAADDAPTGSLADEAAAFKPEQPQLSALEKDAKGFRGEEVTDKDLLAESRKFQPKQDPSPEELFARAETTRTTVPQTAPSQSVKDVNPELSRQMHEEALKDPEAAKAYYGTDNPEEVAARDLMPEVETSAKKHMPNKTVMNRPENPEPLLLKQTRQSDGASDLTDAERAAWEASAKEKIVSGVDEMEGMVPHRESLVTKVNDDGTMNIRMRYSPTDSGFRTAAEALETARYAFKDTSIADEDFTLLARFGDEWREVSPEDAENLTTLRSFAEERGLPVPEEIDASQFSIQLDTNYRITADNMESWEYMGAKNNWLDRLDPRSGSLAGYGQGSLTQNLYDPTSVIHPKIVGATSVAVDKANHMKVSYAEIFQDFTDKWNKMKKPRRAALRDYINEANLNGLKFDKVDLINRGFDEAEIDMVKQWRYGNDMIWYALNDDHAKSLRARGYKSLVNNNNDTRLIGKPLPKNALRDGDEVFDLETGDIIVVSDSKTLTENGARLFETGDAFKLSDGSYTDKVLVKETPHQGYSRVIKEDETVLAYREGYYPVQYDAKWFVTMTVKGKGGKEYTKVLASARNTKDRDAAVKALQADNPKAKIGFKADRRFTDSARGDFGEEQWKLMSSSGMTSQRLRGERIADAGNDLQRMGHANLEDPLQAVAKQIQQMSTRVMVRPVLERMKARWSSNYGEKMGFSKGAFPTNIKELGNTSTASAKEAADARSTFNYIYAMENGYINIIDDAWRSSLHMLSNTLGNYSSKAEEALTFAGDMSPSNMAKAGAFKLMLASNPIRQLIIQSSQNIQLMAIHPQYVAKQLWVDVKDLDTAIFIMDWNKRADKLAAKYPNQKALYERGKMTMTKRQKELFEEANSSGVLQSVDAHAFIRQEELIMAEWTNMQKIGKALNSPLKILQRGGFDIAERHVVMASWLTFRDKSVKAGKSMKNQTVKDEVMGQARLYTYNMNRSGDMPYQQGTLGIVSQFLSVQHKAALQALTNRNLTKSQKAKLMANSIVMFGVDATVVSAVVAHIMDGDERGDIEQMLHDGLIDVTLNEALTLLSGEQQQIDFGDLAPMEGYGLGSSIITLLESGVTEALANSPSGSLFFGANPRLTTAFKTLSKWFHVSDDYEDPELNVKFVDVVRNSMMAFSGYSAAFKTKYAFETGTKISSIGNITDSDVTTYEAAAQLGGFRTKTEEGTRQIKEIVYGNKSFTVKDVDMWYTDLKRLLASRRDRVSDRDLGQRIANEAWRVFNEDRPFAIARIVERISNDMVSGDTKILDLLRADMGIDLTSDVQRKINKLPDGPIKERAQAELNAITSINLTGEQE